MWYCIVFHCIARALVHKLCAISLYFMVFHSIAWLGGPGGIGLHFVVFHCNARWLILCAAISWYSVVFGIARCGWPGGGRRRDTIARKWVVAS